MNEHCTNHCYSLQIQIDSFRQATTNNIRFTYVSKPNQIRDNLIEGRIGGGVANNDIVENLAPKIYMIDINFEHS